MEKISSRGEYYKGYDIIIVARKLRWDRYSRFSMGGRGRGGKSSGSWSKVPGWWSKVPGFGIKSQGGGVKSQDLE